MVIDAVISECIVLLLWDEDGIRDASVSRVIGDVNFFLQAEDGIRDAQESRGLGGVYKRQTEHTDRETQPWTENTARETQPWTEHTAYTPLPLPTNREV